MSGAKPIVVKLTRPEGDPSDFAWWLQSKNSGINRYVPDDRVGSSVKRAMTDHENTAFFEAVIDGDHIAFGRRVADPGW